MKVVKMPSNKNSEKSSSVATPSQEATSSSSSVSPRESPTERSSLSREEGESKKTVHKQSVFGHLGIPREKRNFRKKEGSILCHFYILFLVLEMNSKKPLPSISSKVVKKNSIDVDAKSIEVDPRLMDDFNFDSESTDSIFNSEEITPPDFVDDEGIVDYNDYQYSVQS